MMDGHEGKGDEDVVMMIVDFKGLVLICTIPHNPSKSMSLYLSAT
jgi:hypothetical protein